MLAFWPILASMYGSWFDEHAYMEHGLLVIPAAAYMVWTQRRELANHRFPAVGLGSSSPDLGRSTSSAGRRGSVGLGEPDSLLGLFGGMYRAGIRLPDAPRADLSAVAH